MLFRSRRQVRHAAGALHQELPAQCAEPEMGREGSRRRQAVQRGAAAQPAAGAGTAAETNPVAIMCINTPSGTTFISGSLNAGTSGTVTIEPAASVRVVNGGSITFTATYTDQFGAAKAGLAVTASVSAGRNLSAVATNLVTNADGEVSYTVTDEMVIPG